MRVYFALSYFFVWVFLGIKGRTPDKRISECLFSPVFCFVLFFFFFGFSNHYRGGPLINLFRRVYFALCFFGWFLIGIIGETPDKHISGGLS